MYLVDTNIWLERLLDQTRSKEVQRFLDAIPSERLFMTDFAFHSVAIVLCKLNQVEALLRFAEDAFIEGAVSLIHLEPADTHDIASAVGKYQLDFDDAYQYVAAAKHNLALVSFDSDFDRIEGGRKTPEETLRNLKL